MHPCSYSALPVSVPRALHRNLPVSPHSLRRPHLLHSFAIVLNDRMQSPYQCVTFLTRVRYIPSEKLWSQAAVSVCVTPLIQGKPSEKLSHALSIGYRGAPLFSPVYCQGLAPASSAYCARPQPQLQRVRPSYRGARPDTLPPQNRSHRRLPCARSHSLHSLTRYARHTPKLSPVFDVIPWLGGFEKNRWVLFCVCLQRLDARARTFCGCRCFCARSQGGGT